MNLQLWQLVERYPPDAHRLGARAKLPSGRLRLEDDGELLSHFAVVVRDHVTWVGVDAHQSCHPDHHSGLFTDFADDGLGCGFADVLRSTRQCPQAVVASLDEQHRTVAVAYDGAHRDHEAVRGGSVWVVQVVPLRHASSLPRGSRRRSCRIMYDGLR